MKVSLTSFFLACSIFCSAQKIAVPTGYSFNSNGDYHRYDSAAIRCAGWVTKTAPGTGGSQFKAAEKFLNDWVTGNPYVGYADYSRIDAVFADCPQYKAYYVAGWVAYAMSASQKPADRLKCSYSGIQAVLKAYQVRQDGKKIQDIEDLQNAEHSGKLTSWLRERLR